MKNTKIEWADHTFNPWIGCSKVSLGCKHCYAETLMDHRLGRVEWGDQGTRAKTSEAYWKKPLRWNQESWIECLDCGYRGPFHVIGSHNSMEECPKCLRINTIPTKQRVFCGSLCDVFEDLEYLEEWRIELLELIVATPNLIWMLLTKRPENVRGMVPGDWFCAPGSFSVLPFKGGFPENVWLGVSVEDQETADERIPRLLEIPYVQTRFLSVEPMLGPVDILNQGYWDWRYTYPFYEQLGFDSPPIDWVIVGGESGTNARPMNSEWVRSLRDQCQRAGVEFFFKQWGEWKPNNQVAADVNFEIKKGQKIHYWEPKLTKFHSRRVGKKAAGRLLDGKVWNEVPEVD